MDQIIAATTPMLLPTTMNSDQVDGIDGDPYNDLLCGPPYAQFVARNFPMDQVNNVNMVTCTCGFLANLLSVIVLSRKQMRTSTNTILMGNSIADMIPMTFFGLDLLAHQPFFITAYPYAAMAIYLFFLQLLTVFHSISTLITMTLALWRYVAVLHPLKAKGLCTIFRAKMIIIAIFLSAFILCIPSYILFAIKKNGCEKLRNDAACQNLTDIGIVYCNAEFCIQGSDYAKTFNHLWVKYLVGSQGLIYRFIPCIIMIVATISLIKSLRQSGQRRRFLLGHSATVKHADSIDKEKKNGEQTPQAPQLPAPEEVGGGGGAPERESVQLRKEDMQLRNKMSQSNETKITKMLVIILVLFLLAEIPAGLTMGFIVLSYEKFHACPTGFVPILLVLQMPLFLSATLNFFVYVTMSINFRHTLIQVTGFERVSAIIRNLNQNHGEDQNLHEFRSSSNDMEGPAAAKP